MLEKSFSWLRPPSNIDNPEQIQYARMVYAISWTIALGALTFIVLFPILEPDLASRVIIALPTFPLAILCLILVQRGFINLASKVLTVGVWLIFAYSSWVGGGVYAPAFSGNILLVLLAGILVSRLAALTFAFASTAYGLLLLFADSAGWIFSPAQIATPITIWITQTIFFIIAVVLLQIATESIREALEKSKAELEVRRKTEDALRLSEEKFQKAFHSSPVPMAITSPSRGTLDVNTAFLESFKFLREQVIGRRFEDLDLWVKPLLYVDFEEVVQKKGSLKDIEFQFQISDGSEGFVLASAEQAIFDGESCSLVTIHNITQRKIAEKEIQRLNTELEDRVRERTAQLEALNKDLESFSFSVSHDLRVPLRAVRGFSQELLDQYGDQLPTEALRYQTLVHENAVKMTNLIDNLLEFSKLGKLPINKRQVDLNLLIQEVWDDLEMEREGREIDFQVQILPTCQADVNLIRIVLTNLLGNAIKFTRIRQAPLVEVGSIEENSEMIYFVRDNGTGFDMDYSERLFGVFQRLHKPEDYEGSGIGLATAHRIINRHGGRIWAVAEKEEGAAFFFTI